MFGSLLPAALGQSDTSAEDRFWNPGEIGDAKQLIVKFKKNALIERSQIVERNDGVINTRIDNTKSFVVEPISGTSLKELQHELSTESGVASVEPDYLVKAFAQTTTWGYASIKAPAAKTNGSVDGSGVVVAVVDTGVDYSHTDLSDNIWINYDEIADNGIDDDNNGYIDDIRGYDFIGSDRLNPAHDNDPMDVNGHGTHVAGIIAAEDNSRGVIGVADGATILPVRAIADDGIGTISAITSAIYYAVDNGADVINLSLGSNEPSDTVKDAIDYAAANDVVVVAAAGNDYGFNLYLSYPATYPNVISVGAHDQSLRKTWWSNYGKVDIVAPGTQILSTVPNNQYAVYGGTSMAAPFVSGQVALLTEKYPSFSSLVIRQILENTTSDRYKSGNDFVFGNGIANAEKSMIDSLKSLNLTTSSSRIVADNNNSDKSSATLSAQIIDNNGSPVSNKTVYFATDRGYLSAASDVTDSDGMASTTLTADDVRGIATITASSNGYDSDSIQVILYNDKVYVDNVRLLKNGGSGTTFSIGESVRIAAELYTWAYSMVGDEFLAKRQVDVAYTVKDSSGNVVSTLSGTQNDVSVDYVKSFSAIKERIPAGLSDGRYRLEVQVTDDDSGKVASASSYFSIGPPSAHVLVVPNYQSTTVDLYGSDSYKFSESPQFQHLVNELELLGITYDIWPYQSDHPASTSLKNYPVVFTTSAWRNSTPFAADYLNSGGNLYISGGTDFVSGPDEQDNSELHNGWCAGSYTNLVLGFSCAGLKHNPDTVNGLGGIFNSLSFDIDAFNLSADGRLNQVYADELVASSGASAVLAYSNGINSSAVAGIARDNNIMKLVVTGFGVEGINNVNGFDSRADFIEAIYNYFKPDGVNITSVTSSVVPGNSIVIQGIGFVRNGKTTVRLGNSTLTDLAVNSRTKITATVPSGFTAGTYSLSVTNPFGQTDVAGSDIKVVYASPRISKTTKALSNDRARTLVVRGKGFHKGAKVYVGRTRIKRTSVKSPSLIRARIPARFKTGKHIIKVINPNGKSAHKKGFKMRYGFRQNLSLGSYHSDVRRLQQRLQSGNYYPRHAQRSNYFGTFTRNAVAKYQRVKKLAVTGTLNRSTRNYLNSK